MPGRAIAPRPALAIANAAREARTLLYLSLTDASGLLHWHLPLSAHTTLLSGILVPAALARGSALIPDDEFDQAKMLEWMFWEQYSHEPFIAVRRFRRAFMNTPDEEIDPDLMAKGRRALGVMEMRLLSRDFIVRDQVTLADIALVAYTRVADEGGFDLDEFLGVRSWVARVEQEIGIDMDDGRMSPLG